MVSCGECGVLSRVWCVVESVVCCEECGELGEWCVVKSVVSCGECGVLWRVWCVVKSVVCCEEW